MRKIKQQNATANRILSRSTVEPVRRT